MLGIHVLPWMWTCQHQCNHFRCEEYSWCVTDQSIVLSTLFFFFQATTWFFTRKQEYKKMDLNGKSLLSLWHLYRPVSLLCFGCRIIIIMTFGDDTMSSRWIGFFREHKHYIMLVFVYYIWIAFKHNKNIMILLVVSCDVLMQQVVL